MLLARRFASSVAGVSSRRVLLFALKQVSLWRDWLIWAALGAAALVFFHTYTRNNDNNRPSDRSSSSSSSSIQ